MTDDGPGHTPIEADDDVAFTAAATDMDRAVIAHYFSVGCLHGDHGRCEPRCWKCAAMCRCRCHLEVPAGDGPGDFESRERASAATERRERGRRR